MRVPDTLRRLAGRLRGQEGVTLIFILGIMMITSALVVAAFTSANNELHLTATDTSQKKAYYAAEAGVQDYEEHLTQDGNYLDYCVSPTPANPALNQYYKEGTTPKAPSEYSTVELPKVKGRSGEEIVSGERYGIGLIPAESDTKPEKKCESNNLVTSMVEEKGSATGTFRIMSIGFSGKAIAKIIATFRNANFVSYVWYTMYEVADPVIDGEAPPSEPNYWTECQHFYQEREALKNKQCQKLNNFFGTGESVNGPVHVEDHAGVCGEPTFGRTETDRIEFGGGSNRTEANGYSTENAGGCGSSTPKFKGTHIPPKEVPSLEPPPGDEELIHVVESEYHYYGKTEFVLEGKTMTVKKYSYNAKKEVVITETKNVAYPPNGVIYVSNGTGTCPTYSPFGPVPSYTEDVECGNAYVNGKYEESLTIAAQNDIVIDGNILTPTETEDTVGSTPRTNALLGLIANNFVRLYHPLTTTRPKEYTKCGSAANETKKDLKEPIVYAAILAVKHSVIVDNFDCGMPSLGHFNVYGAVAGLFSNGLSGVINGTTLISGYGYNAEYDNRLQVEEPPHFLNPIQAAWYIQRQTLAEKP